MGDLDTLSIHWRAALDAAEDALDAVSRSRQALQFGPGEMQMRIGHLVHERGESEAALERLALMIHAGSHRRLTGPRASGELLGLGRGVTACVFDLDGVLTASSAPHAAAWQETFDASRRICFAFEGSRRFLELAREADLRCAVVSAGPNTRAILERSGLLDLVDEVIDSDDSVLGACRRLQVHPPNVAAFESTGAGVVAGRAAGVSCVIGVDRAGHVGALVEHGADRVVGDLAELIDPMLAA